MCKKMNDKVKLLELFAGGKSVGKVADLLGWDVVSLDLKDAHINCNILDWDYTHYAPGTFDVIWASPPCNTFSCARRRWIGRHGYTKESLQHDIDQIGLPLLHKTLDIIDYFKPKYWFIENPQTGRMKEYMQQYDHYDVDYCQYSDWGYRKATRIWTNVKGFAPRTCHKHCVNKIGRKHKIRVEGVHTTLKDRYRIPPLLIHELFDCLT